MRALSPVTQGLCKRHSPFDLSRNLDLDFRQVPEAAQPWLPLGIMAYAALDSVVSPVRVQCTRCIHVPYSLHHPSMQTCKMPQVLVHQQASKLLLQAYCLEHTVCTSARVHHVSGRFDGSKASCCATHQQKGVKAKDVTSRGSAAARAELSACFDYPGSRMKQGRVLSHFQSRMKPSLIVDGGLWRSRSGRSPI